MFSCLAYLFRKSADTRNGYYNDWDFIEKKQGLQEKLQQFLELGRSIINETGTLFPEGMVAEDDNICMNGEWVEGEEEETMKN